MSRLHGPSSSLKRKQPDSSSPLYSLSKQECSVYNVIKSKQDLGIWLRDLKRESKIPEIMVNKCIKSLQNKKLIKEVTTKNKGRKHYMAAEFEPSKEITGGNWYDDGSLDIEFINSVKEKCAKSIYELKVATLEAILYKIRESRIFKIEFTIQQIEETVRALVLDNEIVELKSNGKVCYKCISKGGKGEPSIEATASIPCWVCPRISECTPDGIISPKTCDYYEKWLDF